MNMEMLLDLFLGGLAFIVIFLIILLNNIRHLKKSNYDRLWFLGYFIAKFKLDKKKISYKKMNIEVSLINAFIVLVVYFTITLMPLVGMWQYLVEFVLLMALIYAIYEIYGATLIKRGWSKNV